METNPYAPPAALDTPAATSGHQSGGLRYAGFWQRFGAYWIDFVVMLPLMGFVYYMGEKSRMFTLYWFIPGMIIGVLYQVFLVVRFGGTPGKLLLKTRIAMVDGSPVTVKAACLRYAGLFILSLLSGIALVMATLSMSDELYFSLGYVERATKMVEMAPGWYYAVSVLMQIWIWSEFVTMLLNKRRRAVHDYIAGTVVLRT